MATEFDDTRDWAPFIRDSKTMRSSNSFANRWSEQTLAALRAGGVFDNMVDGLAPPADDMLWLDKNTDPAVLKEWDATGASWVQMSFERLFGRAIVTPMATPTGTADALVVTQPSPFIARRMYSLTPVADNTGAVTVQVTGVGTFDVRYTDGTPLEAQELKAGNPTILLFTGVWFEVLFKVADIYQARDEVVATVSSANIRKVANRTALKALNTVNATLAFLSEDGREGFFEWTVGDFSTQITADTQEGLYLKADAVASTTGAWVRSFDGPISSTWFGVSGSGSDETAKIQPALDLAPGGAIEFERGKTYVISSITLKAGSKIITNGATFRKAAASTTYAVIIQDDVTFDDILVSSPGGAADRGIRVIGNRVRGRTLQALADVATDGFGVRIEGTISQSLTGINIEKTSTKNFSSQTQVFYVDDSVIGKSIVDTYTVGLYIINVKNARIGETYASGTHAAATGGAGNNAILMESTSDYGLDGLTIGKVVAKDSAEHAVRGGGAFIMRDVLFQAISTYNTGCLAGSTGGAAFKFLMESSNPGMHENIRVESLYFEDCSNGSAALANMAAVQIFRCKGGHVNNIVGRRKNNSFSCRLGIQVGSNDGFLFSNPDILDCETIAFNPLIPAGYPANMKDVVVQGGRLAVKSTQVTTSTCYYNNTTGVWTNVSMRGVVVEEGRCCVRYETTSGGGAYTGCVFEGEYKHGSGNSGASGAMEGQAQDILMNVKSPLYTTMVMKDGSIWQDTTNALVKIRKAGAYVTL